jgi:hypothetical protein
MGTDTNLMLRIYRIFQVLFNHYMIESIDLFDL